MRVLARTCLIVLATGFLFSLAGLARAQNWPAKPIRVIMPYPPGAGADLVLRMVTDKLAASLGQPFVIDYKPGASTIIASEALARSAPDGYIIGFVTDSLIINPIFKKLGYDARTDFAPISTLTDVPLVVATHPSVPAKNLQEFVAYAKANPGKLNYGSSGPGSSPHLATELFGSMAGIKMTHIPYKGVGLYMTAQIGNEIQVSFSNMFTTMPHWKAGRLKLLASGGVKRSEAFPDLPTIAESGVPGFDALTWYGFLAPAKTPRAVVMKLQQEVAAIVNSTEVRQTFVSQGNEPLANTPDEFAKVIREDADKWGAIGKRLGVKLD